jgi:hypothetical protein
MAEELPRLLGDMNLSSSKSSDNEVDEISDELRQISLDRRDEWRKCRAVINVQVEKRQLKSRKWRIKRDHQHNLIQIIQSFLQQCD